MAYVEPFLRLVLLGTIYNDEQFSYSLSLISAEGPSGAPPSEVPEAIVTAAQEYHQSPGLIGAGAVLRFVKLNEIGTNGRYTQQQTVLHEYEEAVNGAGGVGVPPQIAYCVSLRTAMSRGRAHAGRFYLPMPSERPSVNATFSNAELQTFVGPTQEFLNAVNAAVPGYRVGVTSNLGAGAQQPVTHARFGRVLDTIRSRRRSFDEGYFDMDPLD